MDEAEVVFSVPDDEGARAVVLGREPSEGGSGPDEAGACLEEFARFFVIFTSRECEVFGIDDAGAKEGAGVQCASYLAVGDDEPEGGAVLVEKASVNGGEVIFSSIGGAGELAAGPCLLVDDFEGVVATIEGEGGEGGSVEGGGLHLEGVFERGRGALGSLAGRGGFLFAGAYWAGVGLSLSWACWVLGARGAY